MLRRTFMQLMCGSAFGLRADLDGDGVVDLKDLDILASEWLKQQGDMHEITPQEYDNHLFVNGLNSKAKVRRTVAGPICAKGRVPMEWTDLCDGSGLSADDWATPSYGQQSYDERHVDGTQSIKFQHTVASTSSSYYGLASSTFWSGVDAKNVVGKTLRIRVFIPPGDNNISSIRLRLRTSVSADTKTYFLWTPTRSNITGWQDCVVAASGSLAASGNFDPANVTYMGFILTRADANKPQPYVLIDRIDIFDARLRMPLYTLRIDDNYILHKEIGDYAMSVGIPCTFWNPGNLINNVSGLYGEPGMTLAQNLELRDAGHMHCNHSHTHNTNGHWVQAGNHTAALAEIVQEREWMEAHGLGAGAGIFGPPAGQWRQNHEDLGGLGLLYGRPALGPGRANEYRLMTAWDEHTDITCSTYSSVADSYAQLARQVGTPENNYEDAQRGIYMDLWHLSAGRHLNEGTPAQIKEYLDTVASHIAAGRLKAITYKELYENYLYSEPKFATVEPG